MAISRADSRRLGSGQAESFLELSVFSLACHAERDAFDTLFDHAPDKLNLVKKVDYLPPQPAPHGTCAFADSV